MVQHTSAGTYQGAQRREVLVESCGTDMFEHADRADRVERPVVHISVILHADLDQRFETGVAYRAPRPVRLSIRQRHTNRVHAVMLRGVHDHGAPTAADIKEPHTGLEPELA